LEFSSHSWFENALFIHAFPLHHPGLAPLTCHQKRLAMLGMLVPLASGDPIELRKNEVTIGSNEASISSCDFQGFRMTTAGYISLQESGMFEP
jgi:hypothetical protein